MDTITTAFEDFKSSLRKSWLFLATFILVAFLALIGLIALGFSLYAYSNLGTTDLASLQAPQLGVTEEETEEETAAQSAASGTITGIGNGVITIEMAGEDSPVALSFSVTQATALSMLSENSGEEGSTVSAITINDLAIGDQVIIYVYGEVGAVANQEAYEVVKVTE